MSINITSTSDRPAAGSPTSSSHPAASQEESEQTRHGGLGLMSAVPDPAVIARLANEVFAALPGTVPAHSVIVSASTSPNEASALAAGPRSLVPNFSQDSVPESVPNILPNNVPKSLPNAVPDHPPEAFSFPTVPNSGVAQPPSGSRTGAMNEADFRAIAASLAGALPLAPQATAVAPPAVAPVSSS